MPQGLKKVSMLKQVLHTEIPSVLLVNVGERPSLFFILFSLFKN